MDIPGTPITQYQGSIQPGTTGVWKNKSFLVRGGIRVWFEESVWHYWTIEYADGTTDWMGEGYGMFYIMERISPLPQPLQNLDKRNIGQFQDLGETYSYLLEKKQKSSSWEFTGECWLPEKPASLQILDLSTVTQKRITIVDPGNGKQYYFEVSPVERHQLQLDHLRDSSTEGFSLHCKQCNTPITVKTFPLAQCCSCPNCETYHYATGSSGFKSTGKASTKEVPAIPLGSTGVLFNINWELIGYAQKEENNSYHSKWREYVLYNPMEGFAFLSEYDGHWVYLRETALTPVLMDSNADTFGFQSRDYKVFNEYHYKVTNARGEFPYNLFDNKDTRCREYIAPPYIWIEERDKKEGIRWFFGQSIQPKTVQEAFRDAILPYRVGVGAVQPGSVSTGKLVLATFIGMLFVLFTHFITTINNEHRVLVEQTYLFPDSVNTVTLKTEKYSFQKRSSNIKIRIYADVRDSWFELDATLVNAVTGKEYSLQKGVEYYSGYSDGEYWTEGSKSENAFFTRIPKGDYYLQLTGTRESSKITYSKLENFSLEIIYDVTSEKNLWVALILVLLWPVGKYFHIRYLESERWRNSPFANTGTDD